MSFTDWSLLGRWHRHTITTETHPNPLQLALTLEEPEFQPHYAAWVRHLGHAPAPGEGGNAQFIAWIHAMWTQWETETGLSREYDRDEFLPWLEAQTESSNR